MKKTLALLLSVLMLLSLAACGSAKNSASQFARADMSPAEMPMTEEGYWDESDRYGGLAMNDAAPEAKSAASGGETPAVDPEKIIYSASATVETTEFEQTLERLQTLVGDYGGFIESSSINGSNFYNQSRGYSSSRSANYTIRIPSQRFQELMGSLSQLGNVPYSRTYTENISARYYDVQARLRAYETQEQRLLEMMELAQTVSDVIEIEDRLTELRYEIESLQSALNNWDRQVSYSSVELSVNEVTIYTPEASLSYGQQLGLAVRNGLQTAVDFLSGALLVLLEALPMLILLAALVLLAVVLIRRGVKRRREKKLRRWQQAQQAQQARQTPNEEKK